jgi:DNA transformation protein and related proteins
VTPDDIRDMFSAFGPVDVRRMFSGSGVFVDCTMIALIHRDTIFLKAGAESAAAFEREGLGCFTYRRAGKAAALTSYRRMPERLYDDPEELAVWARQALAAARAAAVKPAGLRKAGRGRKGGPRRG